MGLAKGDLGGGVWNGTRYGDYKETRQDGSLTGLSGGRADYCAVIEGDDKKHFYLENKNGRRVRSVYSRMFIKIK